jgi:hypothetical protein
MASNARKMTGVESTGVLPGRSSTGFRLKSMLRHAGILGSKSRLGNSTSPDAVSDFWSLGQT